LIKASATTTVDQSHTIQIYSGDPSLGGTLSETCTFTFTAVVATIAASSNKVTSVSTSNANPKLGELLTITTLGETGQIGNGDNSGDRDLIWFSPSVFSNFPSTALRLESTSIQINFTSGVTNSGGNACSVYTSGSSYTYTDQLFIGDAIDCHNQTTYSATFNFRVIGRAATTFSLQPVAQISSGAKYKHTSLAGSASLTIDVTNVSAAITVDKSANTIGLPSPVDGSTFSGGVSGRNYILVPYKIRATSNSATITNLDKVLDDYPVGSVFKASSATYSAYGVSTTSITPIDSGGILYFTGPFGVSNSSASTELNLDYSMYVLLPTSGTSTAINTAYGLIGEKVVGSSTSQVAGISISTDSSSITGQSDADTAVAPEVVTQFATSVGKISATLNGTVDANGSSTVVSFCWGSNSNLSGCTSITPTGSPTASDEPVSFSANVTGLNASQTYYFRITGGSVDGSIRNFTTLDETALSITTASLANGTVSSAYSQTLTATGGATSGGDCVSGEGTNSGYVWSLTSGTLPTGITLTSSSTTATLSGTPTTAGNYSFTIQVIDCSGTTASLAYSIEVIGVPSATTVAASSLTSTSATLNGTINANNSSTTVTFCYGVDPTLNTCTSVGATTNGTVTGTSNTSATYNATSLTTGTTYYFRVIGVNSAGTTQGTILNFTPTLTAPTITLSYTDITYGDSSNASPTLTENSDGTSTAYSTSSSSICSVNSSTGVITVLTAGNCVVTVSITNGTNYADGSASDTFVISKKALTVTPTARSLIYGDAEGSYPFTVTGFIAGENESNSANYVAPTCDSDYTSSTSVSSSPRTISCSSGSATNYSFIVTATTELTISNPSAVTKVAEVLSKNRAKLKGESDRTLDNPKFCLNSSSFANKSQCDVGGTQADASLDGSEYVFDATTLSPSTTYYYVIHGRVGGSTFAGEVRSFKTKPEVVTKAGSSVAARSAKLNATVSEALTDPKFCYKATSFSSLVQCLDGGATATATTGTSPLVRSIGFLKKSETLKPFGLLIGKGVTTPSQSVATDVNYELPVSGLNPSTTYYFIIYGKVGSGAEETTYDGGVQNFTTPAEESGSSGGGSGGSSGGSEGGSGSTTTEPTPPPGPRIFSLSKTLACYTGTDVTISGAYFGEGKVTLDGIAVVIKEFSDSSLRVTLPSSSAGRRTISVTTPNGSAIAYIDYSSVPKPIFESIRIPYLSQGSLLSLPFVATNTTSYGFIGKLPAGLTLNASTGEISGTPTENGIFILTLTASNLCGQTQQFVELDIDAPTPNAISHRINFLPGSCSIPDSAKASLEAFLAKAKGLSPRNIIPEIYVSGGGKASDPNSPLADCRQEAICDFLLLENLLGEVLSDVFTGAENRVEIIVYWPRPNDGQ
jgi:hypothetical protein